MTDNNIPTAKITLEKNIQNDSNTKSFSCAVTAESCVDKDTLPTTLPTSLEDHTPPVNPAEMWRYVPVPDEVEKHEEYAIEDREASLGCRFVAARARGRKHKHEGTNCDDWFASASLPLWNIVAVSDGAGSCRFSRVGAKVACQAAIASLQHRLASHELGKLCPEDWQRNEDFIFSSMKIESVQMALHTAMSDAHEAMLEFARVHTQDVAFTAFLDNKPLRVKDLSATLLLAVHSVFQMDNGEEYDFIMSCQVGDGMIAVITRSLTSQLLAKPDSGAFAGETEFLTSEGKVSPTSLRKNTHLVPCKMRALMVMTDGVSDDYFPAEKNIKFLYGDLWVNGVFASYPDIEKIKELWEKCADLQCIRWVSEIERQDVVIRSLQKISQATGWPLEKWWKPTGLAALASGAAMTSDCADLDVGQKLLIWLDAYYQRGSFDDRTLALLLKQENL